MGRVSVYWEKLNTNKQKNKHEKLAHVYTLYTIESVIPICTDRFPTFDLSFECCQSCNVFIAI